MDHRIMFIMGVSGSGKTTVGRKLASILHLPFFDADDFHPAANKEKMRAGIPLTDEDRAGWLSSLNQLAAAQKKGAVIACSALKEIYRRKLSDGVQLPILWVVLEGDFDLIRKRIDARTDHYMSSALLSSQFDLLEIPSDAIRVSVDQSPDEIVQSIMPEINKHSKN